MGIITSRSVKSTETPLSVSIDNVIQKNYLDGYSKEQIMEYIKQNKPKCINVPENFHELMKDIELENRQLLPMALELYQHMFQTFGEFKRDPSQRPSMKKSFFVKPKFGEDAVVKSVESVQPIEGLPLDKTLINIQTDNLVFMKTGEISLDEYNISFNKSDPKKDMMGISKKILSELPNYLKIRFINVFNDIFDNPENVALSSIAKGSYIYKVAKHGALNDINSFRQILAIPNVVNQFHRILNLRISEYMLANKYLDTDIQKGGVSGQKFSVFEQYFKLKNVLKNATKNNNSCVILFLDISNAFGNLNLNKLYQVLELYGIDKKFIDYLNSFYSSLEYYVDAGDIQTKLFKWNDGLVQGCSLSPLLFVTAMNYILVHLDKTYKDTMGYDLQNGMKILLTAFVDDISIVCKDVNSAQFLFDEFEKLCGMLGLPLSKSKCAMMVVNDQTPITGSLTEIPKVSTFKYLGEYLSDNGSYYESYIQFIQLLTRKLRAIDYRKCDNDTKATIFTSIILPWIQKKSLIMYDMGTINRVKIISIIKPYMEQWGITETNDIFCKVNTIISDTTDSVILSLISDESDLNEDLEQNLDVANYVYKDTNIRFEYSKIDDEFATDAELEDLYTISNQ